MSPVARVVLRRTRTHTHKRDEEFADAVVLGQLVKCGD
jgi:hypothetical protein